MEDLLCAFLNFFPLEVSFCCSDPPEDALTLLTVAHEALSLKWVLEQPRGWWNPSCPFSVFNVSPFPGDAK